MRITRHRGSSVQWSTTLTTSSTCRRCKPATFFFSRVSSGACWPSHHPNSHESACADFAITHGVRSNAASPHTPTPQPPPGPPAARVHRLSTLWFWLGGLTSFLSADYVPVGDCLAQPDPSARNPHQVRQPLLHPRRRRPGRPRQPLGGGDCGWDDRCDAVRHARTRP